MDAHETLDAIVGGEFDGILNVMRDAIRTREEIVARRVADSVEIGDTVVLTKLRPKYLSGLKAAVIDKHGQKITVKIDTDADTGRFSNELGLLPGMYEVLRKDEG